MIYTEEKRIRVVELGGKSRSLLLFPPIDSTIFFTCDFVMQKSHSIKLIIRHL